MWAAAAGRLVSGCRPLQVSDLAPAAGAAAAPAEPRATVDDAELRERADAALAALREAHATIYRRRPSRVRSAAPSLR
jgi:hypothetical protein